MYIFLRYSLDNGDIAPMLKIAVICPILKPGSQTNHPVKYLGYNNLLTGDQHAYIRGRSTLSQLLNHIEDAIRNWEEGKATDTIYLDFAKAFDKVDHDIFFDYSINFSHYCIDYLF